MKCPKCGNKIKGKVCKYCNTELPFDERIVSLKQFMAEATYIINRILFPPAKVIFILWTLCWISQMPSDNTTPLSQKIYLVLLGYLFMCGIADLIYRGKRKRYLAYKLKITEKHANRIKKIMDTYYPYKRLLDEAYALADITNTTTDENTFNNTYNRLIEIFTELKKYEYLGVFANSPTEDLNDLIYGREAATKRFHERQCTASNDRSSKGYIFNNYDHMDGHDFEYCCADLLQKNGFSNVEVTQGSGDHGIDIIAEKDDISYAIQCKCYSSNIGNAAVQQAHTGKSIYHKDIAVVLTNQYFTPQAKEEATALGVKLWDRDKLNDLIKNISTI